ncbi:MAG: hypothetical protein A2X36_04205 [Elusimicrobia bacterium GWA2_69_24]|nr:MAG: hypothetical protein A2X36_04205 [Elusimicrobia bacterium GWA2_69_24]
MNMGWLLALVWASASPCSAAMASRAGAAPVGGLRLPRVGGLQTSGVSQGPLPSLALNSSLPGAGTLAPALSPDPKPLFAAAGTVPEASPLVPLRAAAAAAALFPDSPAMPFPAARGPPRSQAELPPELAAFFAGAKAAPESPETRDFLVSLPARFDGMSAPERGAVLAGLEDAAKSAPKAKLLRRTLQALIVRDEVEHMEPRLLGAAVSAARREDVASKTRFEEVRWYHHFWGKIVHPEADGVAQRSDLSISLHVRRGWEKLPSFTAFYRALFAHEYTHRLQYEGRVTEKLGVEIPPVAAEMLRGIELVGLEGLRQGLIGFITENQLSGFDNGRAWMRSAEKASSGVFWKGFLAGAAYELAAQTGRWADAWLLHRLVSSGKSLPEAERTVRGSDPAARLAASRPDAVIFDWDNTLVDERGVVDAIRLRLFRELGVPTPTREEADRVWRTDRDGFYDRFFPGIPRDTVNKTYFAIMERMQPRNPLLPGARETLAALKRRGVPLAVVSNKPEAQLLRELKALGLEDFFAYVQGHTPARELKPSPQPILEAMRALGVAGGNVWYLGDEPGDMAAARGAGAQGIFLGTGDLPRFLSSVVKKLPE